MKTVKRSARLGSGERKKIFGYVTEEEKALLSAFAKDNGISLSGSISMILDRYNEVADLFKTTETIEKYMISWGDDL